MNSISLKENTLKALLDDAALINRMMDDMDSADDTTMRALEKELKNKIIQKVDAYRYVLEELEARVKFWDEQEKSFYEQKKRCKGRLDRFKEYLKETMRLNETKELVGSGAKFVLSSLSPKLDIYNESEIPNVYFKEIISTELDKEALKKDLMSGKEIAGARLVEVTSLRSYLK